jgi:hypothetical protein
MRHIFPKGGGPKAGNVEGIAEIIAALEKSATVDVVGTNLIKRKVPYKESIQPEVNESEDHNNGKQTLEDKQKVTPKPAVYKIPKSRVSAKGQ